MSWSDAARMKFWTWSGSSAAKPISTRRRYWAGGGAAARGAFRRARRCARSASPPARGGKRVSRAPLPGMPREEVPHPKEERMADLTTLESKLGEVTGLAMAAQDLTKKVERLTKKERQQDL